MFLDRNRDRYFSLGETADAAFDSLGSSGRGAALEAGLAKLVEAGILVEDPFGDFPRPCPPISVHTSPLDDDPHLAAPLIGAVLGAASIQRATIELKLRGFARLCDSVAAAAPPPRGARSLDPHAATRIAARFARAVRLTGAFEQCLPIAIATVRFCRGRHYDAQLVIGVKTRPFQAHAWVSAQGMILTDRTSTAKLFTPILIL
ncbi:lasso peptide biosynthesis B2 protein [Sphingomonas pruni]|uniref:lasso peptide biosynthesis B2 protein n=1 Tax=Sphingomonas pruni TaxID=40683 RepID=UPI00083563D8|nr:lasso peptide biosynthesis B2 protein [Sphingomonas pruni]